MTPGSIPEIASAIRGLDLDDLQRRIAELAQADRGSVRKEIEQLLRDAGIPTV